MSLHRRHTKTQSCLLTVHFVGRGGIQPPWRLVSFLLALSPVTTLLYISGRISSLETSNYRAIFSRLLWQITQFVPTYVNIPVLGSCSFVSGFYLFISSACTCKSCVFLSTWLCFSYFLKEREREWSKILLLPAMLLEQHNLRFPPRKVLLPKARTIPRISFYQ